jgi:hypothetical protein
MHKEGKISTKLSVEGNQQTFIMRIDENGQPSLVFIDKSGRNSVLIAS